MCNGVKVRDQRDLIAVLGHDVDGTSGASPTIEVETINLHRRANLRAIADNETRMNNAYLEVISLIERLHRQFLEW